MKASVGQRAGDVRCYPAELRDLKMLPYLGMLNSFSYPLLLSMTLSPAAEAAQTACQLQAQACMLFTLLPCGGMHSQNSKPTSRKIAMACLGHMDLHSVLCEPDARTQKLPRSGLATDPSGNGRAMHLRPGQTYLRSVQLRNKLLNSTQSVFLQISQISQTSEAQFAQLQASTGLGVSATMLVPARKRLPHICSCSD